MMKAWVLSGINNIGFKEVDVPLPQPGEVLVKVKAAGICGSDIPRVYKTGAHKMPLIPGHEFSGEVTAIGKNASSAWMGKRVGIYPLIPCGECAPCKSGHPETCRDYDYLGSRRDGAFAEFVAVPEANLVELPGNVSFIQAAMLEPMAVAVHAMRMGIGISDRFLPLDARIAVCGLGSIGLLLTMFLKERGYRNIYVIGNKESQKERAALFGITEENFYDSRNGDAVKWLMDRTGGADAFFECVGKNECVISGIESTVPGARIVLVGNPYSDMSLDKTTYWKILRNQLMVMGSWNSTFYQGDYSYTGTDDWSYVIKSLKDKRIAPESLISHEMALDELEKGLLLMKEKREDYCKVMLITDGN